MANIRQAGSRPGRSRPFRRVLTGCFQPPVPPPALPLWMVVDERVRLGAPPVGLDQEWGVINCSKKTAYGCGKHGQKVLDGLRLRMRLVKPNGITTSIYLELNNDALRALRAAFGKGDGPPIPIDGKELHARGAVSTTSDQVLVLVVVFRLRGFGTRIFYMVYDTIDGSLAMVPAPPDPSCDIDGMPKPLAVPRDRSNHGVGYDLLFLSRKRLTSQPGHPYNTYEDVVYRWTPGAWSEDGGPWRVQRRRFANGVHEAFIVESMFTMKGQAFFADLAQGLIHCDLSITTEGSVVDFHFIPLPEDAPLESRWAKVEPEDMGPINWYRTLSCTSGSIKFVCIDRSTWPPENMRLIQYTLDLSSKKWSKNMELRSVELWKFLGLKKEMLPETAPKCPVLMSDDSLSLLLPNMRTRKEDSIEDYMCNFKLGQKVRLSWSAHLDHCYYTEPIILPWNFFKTVHPPVNVKPRRAIFL